MLQFLDASIETLIKFELYTTNMPYIFQAFHTNMPKLYHEIYFKSFIEQTCNPYRK